MTLNNRVSAKNIKKDRNHNRCVKSDDTSVVVPVNDRSQRDLTKCLEKSDIDWTTLNRQVST